MAQRNTRAGRVATAFAILLMAGTMSAHAADVVFMNTSSAEEASRSQIDRLNAEFKAATGLTVDPQGYAFGDFQKNLFLRLRSRNAPDLAQISERWLPGLKNQPGIVDFAQVYGRDMLEKTFAPEALAMGAVDGKILALPMLSGSIGLVANKAVLAEAGVAEVPTTIDGFRAALVAVRDKVPNSVPMPIATKNPNSIIVDFMVWSWTFGGQIIDPSGKVVVSSPQTRQALAFMVGLVKDRLAAPDIDRPDSRRLFGQNKAAFYLDAPVARTFARVFSGKGKDFDPNVMPAAMPVAKAGDVPAAIQWGFLLVQFAGAQPKREAPTERYLDLIATDGVQNWLSEAQSAVPTTISARQQPWFKQNAYLSGWAAANKAPRTNEIALWSNEGELTQIIGEEVQGALLGQKSADAAIDAMQTRLTDSMAKASKG